MKVKKLLLGILSFICFGFSVFALTSCEHVHEWNEGEIVNHATCTEAGLIAFTCKTCEETKVEVVSIKEHEYKEELILPTCTKAGHSIHTCENCGYSYTDSYVSALGHTKIIDEAVEPTCTETGLTEGSHCAVCNDVLVAQKVVAAVGHSYTSVVTNPTCTQRGYTTNTCKSCNNSYIDNYVNALGHKEVIDEAVEPTCTKTGLTEGKHCSRCNNILLQQKEVPSEHNYVDYVCIECGYEFYTEGLEYELSRYGTYYSVDGIGTTTDTDIVIPSTYNGLPVQAIDELAFWCSSLTSITIPNSVTSIGDRAFLSCSSLTNITIPDSVTSIGHEAFHNCSSLTNITIPDSVTFIGSGAFWNCFSLKNIEIPNGDTIIGTFAFANCRSLESIDIPNCVTELWQSSFHGCNSLKSITIPDNVIDIGINAFEGCISLETVYYTGTEEQWNSISISYGNLNLKNATIIYNYKG